MSDLRTEHELSDAIVKRTSLGLRAPTDAREMERALELLPRLQTEAHALLEENRRLRRELVDANARLANAAPPSGE